MKGWGVEPKVHNKFSWLGTSWRIFVDFLHIAWTHREAFRCFNEVDYTIDDSVAEPSVLKSIPKDVEIDQYPAYLFRMLLHDIYLSRIEPSLVDIEHFGLLFGQIDVTPAFLELAIERFVEEVGGRRNQVIMYDVRLCVCTDEDASDLLSESAIKISFDFVRSGRLH